MAEVTQAKPHPLRATRPLYHPFRVECTRCGQEAFVERGGAFRDADYYELFHEHMELQAVVKLRTRKAMEYAFLGSRLAKTVLEQEREIQRLRELIG